MPPLRYGEVAAAIYLKVSLFDFLTLFCARCEGPFFSIKPSPKLLVAAVCALAASAVLAVRFYLETNKRKSLF